MASVVGHEHNAQTIPRITLRQYVDILFANVKYR